MIAALLLAVSIARAQEAPSEPEAQTDVAVDDEPAPSPEILEARERAARATQLYEQGDYEGALAEFNVVYELLEGDPAQGAVLYNTARCHERLFQYDRAMQAYHRYQDHIGPDGEYYAAVQAKIESLDSLLGRVRVAIQLADFELFVDGHRIGPLVRELRVPVGTHRIEARADGYVPASVEVEVAAGREVLAELALERLAEEYRGLAPFWFVGALGFGAASAIAGIVFGSLALVEQSEVEECANDPTQLCPKRFDIPDRNETVHDYALVADVAFFGGVLFGAAAIVLALLTDFGGDETFAALRPSGLGIEGAF